jgi:hypothetical protein
MTDHEWLLPEQLCSTVIQVLSVDAAAISVTTGPQVSMPIGFSEPEAAVAEALQFTLNEGPCLRAYRDGTRVLVPDITAADSLAGPMYAAALIERTSYRAVFAFPLIAGAGSAVGVLNLYRRSPGPLVQLEEADAIAARMTVRVLDAEMDREGEWVDSPLASHRRHVWTAQGLTMTANRIGPGQALDLLRAQAFSANRLVDDLAEDIVLGRSRVPVVLLD